ncbi:hypothetical protein ATE71_08265 [Sphingopyxis sp. H115]|nr:hypothetical protein ATE71_08265 [Sphingopyxis sp. H115]
MVAGVSVDEKKQPTFTWPQTSPQLRGKISATDLSDEVQRHFAGAAIFRIHAKGPFHPFRKHW